MTAQLTTPPPSVARRRLGLVGASRTIGNEVYKGLLSAWQQRNQILVEVPLFLVSFLFVNLLLGRGDAAVHGRLRWSFDQHLLTWSFLGFAAFLFFYLHTAKLFWRLLAEKQTGTIEQLFLSPLPAWLVLAAGRVAAGLVETAVVVALVYAGVDLIVGFHVPLRPAVLLPLTLLIVTVVGYSLVIAAGALRWRRVEMVHEVFPILVYLAGGVFVPLERMPGWLQGIGRFVPITPGVTAIRGVLLDGQPLDRLWGNGGLVPLVASTVGWSLAGVVAFGLASRGVRRRGALGS